MRQDYKPNSGGCGYCQEPLITQTVSRLIPSQQKKNRWKLSKKNRVIYWVCNNPKCPSYEKNIIVTSQK